LIVVTNGDSATRKMFVFWKVSSLFLIAIMIVSTQNACQVRAAFPDKGLPT